MKGKRFLVTFVFVLSFILALSLSAYAATITLYSGADATSTSTTHNGSLTLTGNTEANETVTVYFTDDGRAWKAGETVFFTEDTNLYTIECTKISSVSEYNNATGGGNYIITTDLDFTQSGRGPINGDNCTTRIFMNGKSIKVSNADGCMMQGNSQSFYLLGEGYISSAWGGGVYRGHCNNSKTDVIWVIGKDIIIETNKDNSQLFLVWNTLSSKSLSIHIYGTIIKAQSGTVGTWSIVSADSISTDYDIYFHEGASVCLTGCIVRYGASTVPADTVIGEIIFNGADVTLSSADYFFYDKSSSAYNGIITVNSGTFNIANSNSLAKFKAGIVSDKKAQEINSTSFKVVCNECAFEKTLGDDFVGLTSDFTINSYCPKCKTIGQTIKVEKVFEALGYSVNSNGTALSGGYTVNQSSLEKYMSVVGDVKYGIVIANADRFGGKSFFDENGNVNTDTAVQVKIDNQYSNFNCLIRYGTASDNTINLIICAYVIDANGTSFIQHTTGNTVESSSIANSNLKSITLDMIVALLPGESKEQIA